MCDTDYISWTLSFYFSELASVFWLWRKLCCCFVCHPPLKR